MPIQPILKLTYLDNVSTFYDKKIEVKLFPVSKFLTNLFKKITKLSANGANNKTNGNLNAEIDSETNSENNLKNSMMTIITTIWKSIEGGGKLPINVPIFSAYSKISFSKPIQTSENTIIFSDLKISFNKFQSYLLIFIFDGIESGHSKEIVVTENVIFSEKMFRKIDYVVVTLTFIFVALATSKYHSIWFIFVGILSAALSISIIPFIGKNIMWKSLIAFGMFSLIICLLEILYQNFERKKKRTNKFVFLSYF